MSLFVTTGCGSKFSESEARAAFYAYLEAVDDEIYSDFLKVTEIDSRYSKEIFEGVIVIKKFTKAFISNFGIEASDEYINQSYGDFARGFLITDKGLLESIEDGIRISQEGESWLIETYPIGIYLVAKKGRQAVISTDEVVTDYKIYMDKFFRPIVQNCKDALGLIEENEFQNASELMKTLANGR